MRPPLALFVLALALACGNDIEPREPTGTGLSPDSFRVVLTELALARVEALPDTQAWIVRRGAILERHGLEAGDLREFVDAWGSHDELMESIYRELGSAIDSVARERAESEEAPGIGSGAFPDAEEAARSAARAGEAVDTIRQDGEAE